MPGPNDYAMPASAQFANGFAVELLQQKSPLSKVATDNSDSYIGTKVVKAKPMNSHEFKTLKNQSIKEGEENAPGYQVTYEDNYTSWSPKEVFERCYRKITSQEKGLM